MKKIIHCQENVIIANSHFKKYSISTLNRIIYIFSSIIKLKLLLFIFSQDK